MYCWSSELEVGIPPAGSQEQHKQDHQKRLTGGETALLFRFFPRTLLPQAFGSKLIETLAPSHAVPRHIGSYTTAGSGAITRIGCATP